MQAASSASNIHRIPSARKESSSEKYYQLATTHSYLPKSDFIFKMNIHTIDISEGG